MKIECLDIDPSRRGWLIENFLVHPVSNVKTIVIHPWASHPSDKRKIRDEFSRVTMNLGNKNQLMDMLLHLV